MWKPPNQVFQRDPNVCVYIYMYIHTWYWALYDNSAGEDDVQTTPNETRNIQEWVAYINDSKQDKDFGGDQRICGIQC